MEFYTALKRNEAVVFSRKEMELDKVSQTQKCKYSEVRDEAALVECLPIFLPHKPDNSFSSGTFYNLQVTSFLCVPVAVCFYFSSGSMSMPSKKGLYKVFNDTETGVNFFSFWGQK